MSKIMLLNESVRIDLNSYSTKTLAQGEFNEIRQFSFEDEGYMCVMITLSPIYDDPFIFFGYRQTELGYDIVVYGIDNNKELLAPYSNGFDFYDVEHMVSKFVEKIINIGLLDADRLTVREWARKNLMRVAKKIFPGSVIKPYRGGDLFR